MTPGRVIILAYYFPPLTGVASERAVSLASGLRELGWDATVVTAENGFYHRSDDRPEHRVPVIRTGSFELSRVIRGVYRSATRDLSADSDTTVRPVQTGRAGRELRRLVREWVYVPDAQIGWLPFAVSESNRALSNGASRSVLLSTSVPFTAHLAAMRLARRWGLPWVAEFRDPWSTAYWPDQIDSALRRRVNTAIEGRVVSSADHVIVTSQSTLAELAGAHPGLGPEKISVVTNGFTPWPEAPQPGSGEPMELVYAGGVTAGEDLDPLLQAMARVHARHPGGFRFRIVGPSEPWLASRMGATRPPWLEFEGIVSPARARDAVRRSSALVLVQRHPAYRTTLPGKAFEYIGARRPIVAVISPDRELANLLRAHADARIVAPDQVDSVAHEIECLLAEHRAGILQGPRVPPETTAPLQRTEQARKLAAILGQVAAGRRNRKPY